MRRRKNPVQSFIRMVVRLMVFVPGWYYMVWPMLGEYHADFGEFFDSPPPFGRVALLVVFTILIFWAANIVARMFYILPEWERIVILRLGKSVGSRGPGLFIVPPFIYEVARIIDIRIITYEVKATRTLTSDNVPIDVTAAIEMEIENPEKAAIRVQDYWKTTEWGSMEALKSAIGKNDLRTLLSDTEQVGGNVKQEIDEAAKEFGVNVRAVRITDISAPQSLIEELAVIARAERSAKAKRIEAEAEKKVAGALAEASQLLGDQKGAMQLRQIQALLEMSKEESSTIIIYPMDSLNGQDIASATAGSKGTMAHGKPTVIPKSGGSGSQNA